MIENNQDTNSNDDFKIEAPLEVQAPPPPKEQTLEELMSEIKISIDSKDLKILELTKRNEFLESGFVKVKDMLRSMIGKRSD